MTAAKTPGRLCGAARRASLALAIADKAMLDLIQSEGVPHDEHRTAIGFTNQRYEEVPTLAEASPAMRQAFEWLQPRGYVALARDEHGEFVNIVRRPGED